MLGYLVVAVFVAAVLAYAFAGLTLMTAITRVTVAWWVFAEEDVDGP